jgi:hypothetical protein
MRRAHSRVQRIKGIAHVERKKQGVENTGKEQRKGREQQSV